MPPLVLVERLPVEGEEDVVPLPWDVLTTSPLDEDVSWLLARSLLALCVQPALALMPPVPAAAPAAVALAMAPSPSKHPSNNEVARMAVKSPKA